MRTLRIVPIGLATIVIIIRLFQNLPLNAISGINGMYYPLMVRELLREGKLPFRDVPGLFYLAAGLVKVTRVGPVPVFQLLNTFIPPLAIIPLARFWETLRPNRDEIPLRSLFPVIFAAFAFSAVSYSGDLIKNGLAMPLAALFLSALIQYRLVGRETRMLVLAVCAAVATAAIHFGTFAVLVPVALSYTLLPLGSGFNETDTGDVHSSSAPRKRRIMIGAVISAAALGLFIIGLSDSSRLLRFFSLTGELFERPLVFTGHIAPPYFVGLAGTLVLTWASASGSFRSNLGFLVPQYLLLFPFFDGEYLNRFMLLLVLPQALHAIALLAPLKRYEERAERALSRYLVLASILGLVLIFNGPMEFSLSDEQQSEILAMKTVVNDGRENVLVIAHHGLEWWAAWLLEVDVARPGAWDPILLATYSRVYSLVSTAAPRPPGAPVPPEQPPLSSSATSPQRASAIGRADIADHFVQLIPDGNGAPAFSGRNFVLLPLDNMKYPEDY